MIRRIRKLVAAPVIVVGVALAGGLRAAASGGDDDAPRKGSEVSVKTIEEGAVRGRLITLSLKEGLRIRTDAGEDRVIPLPDLVRVETDESARDTFGRLEDRSHTPDGRSSAVPESLRSRDTDDESTPSRMPRGLRFTLSGGDCLYGRVSRAGDESVVLETTDLGFVEVPLEWVTRVDNTRRTTPTGGGTVEWQDRTGTQSGLASSTHAGAAFQPVEDLILLTNGDVVRGFVTSIDAEGMSIEGSLGETKVPYRLVVSARLGSPAPARLARPYIVLTFRESGRLTATDIDWSGDVARLWLRDGRQLQVEGERIVRVEVVGGRWEWLSAHEPVSNQHTPMLSLGWEYENDRNVLGGAIAVAGETFEHGIGVHSRSSLTYDLKGAYSRFATYFGIDDDSGPYADVSVRILVDGKPRFERTNVRRGTLHGPVRLDVARAKRIELVVDFGRAGDLQDRFNWVEAALIR